MCHHLFAGLNCHWTIEIDVTWPHDVATKHDCQVVEHLLSAAYRKGGHKNFPASFGRVFSHQLAAVERLVSHRMRGKHESVPVPGFPAPVPAASTDTTTDTRDKGRHGGVTSAVA
jgi:hypothetical protein